LELDRACTAGAVDLWALWVIYAGISIAICPHLGDVQVTFRQNAMPWTPGGEFFRDLTGKYHRSAGTHFHVPELKFWDMRRDISDVPRISPAPTARARTEAG
jgi:hypothetical protein